MMLLEVDVVVVLLALLEHPAQTGDGLSAHACIGKSTHSHEINEYDCTKEQDFVNWGEPEARVTIAICEIARSARVIRAHSTGFTQRDSI
jgi:hypothetical protein